MGAKLASNADEDMLAMGLMLCNELGVNALRLTHVGL